MFFINCKFLEENRTPDNLVTFFYVLDSDKISCRADHDARHSSHFPNCLQQITNLSTLLLLPLIRGELTLFWLLPLILTGRPRSQQATAKLVCVIDAFQLRYVARMRIDCRVIKI